MLVLPGMGVKFPLPYLRALRRGVLFYSAPVVALESAPLFRTLDRTELTALRRIARELRFGAGDEIFHEGEPADGVYLVKDGLVEIAGARGDATRRVFSKIEPGEVFGEMAVIEHRARSATASAACDTTVYFIPRGEMLHFIERSPGLALSLLQQISHRLREFNQLYLSEVLQTERLAAVGGFARSILHDLKNPLNVIGHTAQAAGLPDATPEARRLAQERILKQVERINDLVSDILDFTQSTHAAAMAGKLVPTDYAGFVHQLFAELESEAQVKCVLLEFGSQPPAVSVRLDAKRLRRVFYNLLHNATDVMPTGGKIILRFGRDDTEVVTEIADSGPGIAPEMAGRLFEVFATHGKEHGTGLGLSICKKIIEDHGGRIWARNQAGGGAVFGFALPLA